ncbi:MAG TPA: hypothetical protein VGG72_04590 [Bryobacteraceae bacterium]|jgi:hypothetical protein
MRHTRNTTILRTVLSVFLLAFAVFAHEGFDHVTGTIAKVTGNVVTVKTAKGNVDVKLDSKTEISKNDQKAQVADLKIGTRVVVDVPEGSKDMVAHSIKLGVASPAKPPTH